jgi:hypothetical protein
MKTTQNQSNGAIAASKKTEASLEVSTTQRLQEINLIEKPARTARIKLRPTLVANDRERYVLAETVVSFRVPKWITARAKTLWQYQIIKQWVENANWLTDPIHGLATQKRFVEKWSRVMDAKDFWADRDLRPTGEVEFAFQEDVWSEITAAAEFLNVSIEVLLVGIMVSESIARTVDEEPRWRESPPAA